MQAFLSYLDLALVGLCFLGAVVFLWQQFRPNAAKGCSGGCGDACPASNLEQLQKLQDLEDLWAAEQKNAPKNPSTQLPQV